MRNIKLTLEYDGSGYAGWQIQSRHRGLPTVQETLERTLKKILCEKVKVTGSGRTDAGVSAMGQVACFRTGSQVPLRKIQGALNALLSDTVSVTRIEEAAEDFCPIKCVRSKVYRYLIANLPHPAPVLRQKVYRCPFPLDIPLMRREAKALVGRHDFKAFCASGSSAKTTVRTIQRITIKNIPYFPFSDTHIPGAPALIAIDIEADGFLYNMVRNIVGTLIDAGRGRFAPGATRSILRSRDRKKAGPKAPAHGLYLLNVAY